MIISASALMREHEKQNPDFIPYLTGMLFKEIGKNIQLDINPEVIETKMHTEEPYPGEYELRTRVCVLSNDELEALENAYSLLQTQPYYNRMMFHAIGSILNMNKNYEHDKERI